MSDHDCSQAEAVQDYSQATATQDYSQATATQDYSGVYTPIDCKRFVARKLMDSSGIKGATFVDLTGEYPVIEPFSRETASTEYFPDQVILLTLLPEGQEATLASPLSALSLPDETLLAGASTPSAAILPLSVRRNLRSILS